MDIELEPEQAGFAPDRLDRVDRHFARYVDDGRLAGWQPRWPGDGESAHTRARTAWRDREAGLPVEPDTLWRIYSMTKPVVSVAAMMLWEEGRLRAAPTRSAGFMPVVRRRHASTGKGSAPTAVHSCRRRSRSGSGTCSPTPPGMTYGFLHAAPRWTRCTALPDVEFGPPEGLDPRRRAAAAGPGVPLLHKPGTRWHYSVSTDVLGRVVEVASGRPLDEFFADRIFKPLDMRDTALAVPAEEAGHRAPGGAVRRRAKAGQTPLRHGRPRRACPVARRVTFCSGGGGLFFTTADYLRFTRMLLERGELDGVRLLGSRTVDFMTRNHLPGGVDIPTIGRPMARRTRSTASASGSASRSPSTRCGPRCSPPRGSSPGAGWRRPRSGWTRSSGSRWSS